jgi:hypothetical protein
MFHYLRDRQNSIAMTNETPKSESAEFKHYVYVYLDPLKPGPFVFGKFKFDFEPFYIGLGKNKRIDAHIRDAQDDKQQQEYQTAKYRKIRKILNVGIEPVRYKLYEGLTLDSAIRFEKYFIALIGRRDLKEGCNLTDGGEGHLRGIMSEEVREKHRKNSKALWDSGIFDDRDFSGEKNPFYNKEHTDETKEKIREKIGDSRKGELNSNYGNNWSEEQKKEASLRQKDNHKHLRGENSPSKRPEVRKKSSDAKLGLKNPMAALWKLISPTNEVYMIEGGIDKALREFGLTYNKMRRPDTGEFKHKSGWTMFRIEKNQ